MQDPVLKDLSLFLADVDKYQAKEDHIEKLVEEHLEFYSKVVPDFFELLSPTTIKAIEDDLRAEEWKRLSANKRG
jgi:hypothetical protein